MWQVAKSRAAFRTHLMTYLIINGALWAIWLLTGGADRNDDVPWPLWPMLGWGIGLAFSYYNAFHKDPIGDTYREYEKLQQEKERRGL